jgi:chaperonin GroEL (HSP60 family)
MKRKSEQRRTCCHYLRRITNSVKPRLIIAEDVGEEGLAALVLKKLRGPLQVAAVRTPGCADQRKRMLRDIALLTGGKAITEGLDIQSKNIQISDLGQAKKITIGKNNTVVEGGSKHDQLPYDSLRLSSTPCLPSCLPASRAPSVWATTMLSSRLTTTILVFMGARLFPHLAS